MVDRVENAAGEEGLVASLLAHVMTHEIAHFLQGVSPHSRQIL